MKELRVRSFFFALFTVFPALAGCSKEDPLAPPDVLYGQDICVLCGMIVSDDRYASAAVTQDSHGVHHKLAFDDVGCLLRLETMDGDPILARYVADFTARTWLSLDQATFLHSEHLQSPMAFGVAACPDPAAAERLMEQYAGDLLDVAGLRERFAAGELHIWPGETGQSESGSDETP